ncbi:MAG: DUF1761 domain-containing protein [Devosia sp.]|nr:DUF1761 domain-containing protein [Devosia sp.]
MQQIPINWLAVIFAAVIRLAVGAVWYSPVAFGPVWQKTVGVTQAQMMAAMPRAITVDAIGSLIMAFILLHAVVYAGAADLVLGGTVGALNWLGFVAVVLIATSVYEQRPLRSAVIAAGFNLVALILMGALLAVWR